MSSLLFLPSISVSSDTQQSFPPPTHNILSVWLWDCFDEIVDHSNNKSVGQHQNKQPNILADINKEIDEYLDEPTIDKCSDPIVWWTQHKHVYSRMSALAAVYLFAPATSVYSERAFSEAGNVFTEKKSRLTPEHAETLIFLHHNLLQFELKNDIS